MILRPTRLPLARGAVVQAARTAALLCLGLAIACLSPATAVAQPQIDTRPIPAPAEPDAIPLGTPVTQGIPPESWFNDNGRRAVRNVSRATLTPVLPAKEKATGAAVIIAPGGAFSMLSMDNEGWPVARWFADRGVAAFVLKYRLNPTPANQEAWKAEIMAAIQRAMSGKADLPTPPAAVEDGRAALRMVRANAKAWNVDPKRVGMIGFSAGAMTALAVTLDPTNADRPDFLGVIYGPMLAVTPPPEAPPMFVALAADDPLFGGQGFGLAESWRKAGRPVELHSYEHGGHGFGMGAAGTTTVDWMQSFHHWLDTSGLLDARR